MKALLRNCQHSSDVFITMQYDSIGAPKNVYKSSSTNTGIKSLINEFRGAKWYKSLNNNILDISVVNKTDYYYKLKSSYIDGTHRFYYDGFSKNKKYIYLMIYHYCKVWKKSISDNELFTIHGDFSIDNVIFDGSVPVIIDWEHFKENIAPIGFDSLNLIFEQLWFDKKKFNSDILFEVTKMLLLLKSENCLSQFFWKNPLSKTIDLISNHSSIWNSQASKLPVMQYTSIEVVKIDKILTQMIENN